MVRDEEKFEQALQFRKRGFTLEEIARICEVSKGTVSKWLKNNVISAEVTKKNKKRAGVENVKRLQLMSKARGRERTLRYKEIELSAETEYKHYKKDPQFIAGLTAYMAVGDLTHPRSIRLSSSRIFLHQSFISFAVEYLGVPKTKIKLWLLLYPSHTEETCMRKWHRATKVPYSQFHHNQIIKAAKTKSLHPGVGNTVIGNTAAKKKLIRWIELLTKDILK